LNLDWPVSRICMCNHLASIVSSISSETTISELIDKGLLKILATPCHPVSYPVTGSSQYRLFLSTLPLFVSTVFVGPEVLASKMSRSHAFHSFCPSSPMEVRTVVLMEVLFCGG